jgi:hypothetical protein
MELLYPHCAGLDVHKDSVVACARHMVDGKVTADVKTFKTTTHELMELSEWLSSQGKGQSHLNSHGKRTSQAVAKTPSKRAL